MGKGFYGRRMAPEPLLNLLKKLDAAGVTDEDIAALAGLATELADKQDKIDSEHMLDADLVDDSTSTHKFTSADNLSKLSGIESGAEVNTIESISVNNTPLTPDANKNVNIVISGGSQLYEHNIVVNTGTDCNIYFSLITNSSTPLTTEALLTAAMGTNIKRSATGFYDGDDDVTIITAVYYDGSEIMLQVIGFDYDGSALHKDDYYGTSANSISDSVVTL